MRIDLDPLSRHLKKAQVLVPIATRGPLRVKLGRGAMSAQCPDHLRKRPSSGHRWMSQKCQFRTEAPHKSIPIRSPRRRWRLELAER